MKNLAHVPLEVLEQTPERVGMRWELRQPTGVPARKVERRYSHRNITFNQLNNRLTHVIHNSVGKHWDSVYSRLVEMTKGVKFDFDLNWVLNGQVAMSFWSLRNERWEFRSHRRWGHTKDLYDYIRRIKVTSSLYYPEYFYYICPISKMLRTVKTKQVKVDHSPDYWRSHYAFMAERRRKHKERRRAQDHLLRMINNKEILQFYSKIVQEYRYMLKEREEALRKYLKAQGDYALTGKARFYMIYHLKQLERIDKETLERQMKMERLRFQIEELEKGNFDCFFESNVYLYGRQKECHHYAQP